MSLFAVGVIHFSLQNSSLGQVLKLCVIAGKLLTLLKIPHIPYPRVEKCSFSILKSPPFPPSAIDLWHFIIKARSLQPNRQTGQAVSDSLTVCLNSRWRLCFHSPGETPSAKVAWLPRRYLHIDLPSASSVRAG